VLLPPRLWTAACITMHLCTPTARPLSLTTTLRLMPTASTHLKHTLQVEGENLQLDSSVCPFMRVHCNHWHQRYTCTYLNRLLLTYFLCLQNTLSAHIWHDVLQGERVDAPPACTIQPMAPSTSAATLLSAYASAPPHVSATADALHAANAR
jgi:hypothetical protein